MNSYQDSQQPLHSRLDALEHRLSLTEGFPYTKKLLNLDNYLKNNYNEFIRLQNDLAKYRKQSQVRSKISVPPELQRLNKQNKELTIQLSMLKFRNDQAQKQSFTHQIPLPENQRHKLKELETEIYDLSIKVNYLRRKNKAYNDGTKAGDMFGEYENMIRELESHRKLSFELTEEFKHYIKQINAKTGRNENPNTLLIHMK